MEIQTAEHWKRIPGFNFKWGHRVIPDPEDLQKVYITTSEGGVWHGSVNGEDRPLDIVTLELQPGAVAPPFDTKKAIGCRWQLLLSSGVWTKGSTRLTVGKCGVIKRVAEKIPLDTSSWAKAEFASWFRRVIANLSL